MLPAGHRVAVFDFEHTVFAMGRFIHDHVSRAFERFGVPRQYFMRCYRETVPRYRECLTPPGLCRRIAAECGLSSLHLEITLAESVFSNAARSYLSPHLNRLVARARMTHDRIILLCSASDPFKRNWLRHLGVYDIFRSEEVVIAVSKRSDLHRYLGAAQHVTYVTGYQRDARDLASYLNPRGIAVVPIVVRQKHLDRAIELL